VSHSDFLFQAFIYLAAAVVAVPVAKRLGLGSVLGYLFAGAIIGPYVLGLVGQGGQASEGNVMHFAEFGVVMMLFLIGLELQPSLLWRLRVPILGMGSAQVLITAAVAGGIGMLLGYPLRPAIALGLIFAMSSTAIVLQSLQERNWLKLRGGQAAFSVLLFQDIAVIPILALMSLLAAGMGSSAVIAHNGSLLQALPAWQQALAVIGAGLAVIAGGRFLSRPVFRFIASARLPEVFTAFALMLVIGISLLMRMVGLSPALGAFLAGVVLAESDYRHELEGDIEPFKGLLLGLFFLSVGASIDFPFILQNLGLIVGATLAIVALKFIVLLGVARIFQRRWEDAVLFALALSQVGEFAFVLIGVSSGLGVLEPAWSRGAVAVVALSMMTTPPLLMLLARLPRRIKDAEPARAMDTVEPEKPGKVIIAGFGRMGNIIGRFLQANDVPTTVLDVNTELVDGVRKVGLRAWYGDASRLDMLRAAGADKAELLIITLSDTGKIREIGDLVRKHFPHLKILVRSRRRVDAYELINAGFDNVYRETLGTSLDMGADALHMLGFRAYHARRAALAFRKHNEAALQELAKHWGSKSYMAMLRAKIEEAENLIRGGDSLRNQVDAAWDNEALRDAAAKGELKR
jgi:monovalent cation:proton antiporter-2 (CPA2) family protein